MTEAVVDSSAALAVLNDEPGAAEVWSYLPGACISAINAAEVATKLIEGGTSEEKADEFLERLTLTLVPFDRADVRETARLRPVTRHAGLSLGDRACLALALRLQAPAISADRSWAHLEIGLDVRLIR